MSDPRLSRLIIHADRLIDGHHRLAAIARTAGVQANALRSAIKAQPGFRRLQRYERGPGSHPAPPRRRNRHGRKGVRR